MVEIMRLMNDKILQRARTGSEYTKSVQSMFGRHPKGITYVAFTQAMKYNFGIRMNDEQTKHLFKHFDIDGLWLRQFRLFL
jgi:hypothetical protein